jgi:adenosylcobinamide-GDP ribazoletransferase
LVGACIGAAVGGAAAGLWHLVPPLVAASVAMVLGLLITGAFHEDGLADMSDAFGGGWTIERRMEILKDPRHGSYGVAAMCASIVVRVVCLGSLPGPAAVFAAAVAAHAVARAAAVGLMVSVRPAAATGLGADYARRLSRPRAAVGMLTGIALAGLAVGWWVAPLVLAGLVAMVGVGALAVRKVGGIGGDVLGACEQVAECLCLVVATGLAAHSPVWWS